MAVAKATPQTPRVTSLRIFLLLVESLESRYRNRGLSNDRIRVARNCERWLHPLRVRVPVALKSQWYQSWRPRLADAMPLHQKTQ
jgi:hypothetical protein